MSCCLLRKASGRKLVIGLGSGLGLLTHPNPSEPTHESKSGFRARRALTNAVMNGACDTNGACLLARPADTTDVAQDVLPVTTVTGHLVPDELQDPRTERLHKTAAGSKGKQAEAEWISFAQAVVRGEIKQLDTRHLKTVNQAINRHIDNLLQKCQFLSAATGATITFVHDPHPGWLGRSNRSGGAHPAAFRPIFGVCTGTGRAEYSVTASSMSRGLGLVREYIKDLEQKKQGKTHLQ